MLSPSKAHCESQKYHVLFPKRRNNRRTRSADSGRVQRFDPWGVTPMGAVRLEAIQYSFHGVVSTHAVLSAFWAPALAQVPR